MSAPETENELQEVGLRLAPLLKEYAEKVLQLSDAIRTLQDNHSDLKNGPKVPVAGEAKIRLEFGNLEFRAKRLVTPAEDLCRHVSQFVEHGKLDLPTRLELSLRLAELEGALHALRRRLKAGLNR